VTSSFFVQQFECNLVCHDTECIDYCSVTPAAETAVYATVIPPWTYSYQCSSAVLINYVPVLMYSMLLSGLIMPIARLIIFLAPGSWKMYARGFDNFHRRRYPGDSINDEVSRAAQTTITPLSHNLEAVKTVPGDLETTADASTDHRKDNINRKPTMLMFHGEQYVSRLYLDLGKLLTFGLASPLLIFGVVLDCWSNLLVLTLFIVKDISSSSTG
jgi:hypothetical protein